MAQTFLLIVGGALFLVSGTMVLQLRNLSRTLGEGAEHGLAQVREEDFDKPARDNVPRPPAGAAATQNRDDNSGGFSFPKRFPFL
uniref:Uncharacterized protein n=1 Tax=Globodera rostochiensis TaxID=31243 RepID=A0A914I442_GLORO